MTHTQIAALTCSNGSQLVDFGWFQHAALNAKQTFVRNSSFQSRNVYLFQKRHPCTGILNSETSGDSANAFLHCGDVLEHAYLRSSGRK